MVFKNCCCCIDLRIGAMIIAILNILEGLSTFGMKLDWYVILGAITAVLSGICLLYGSIKYHETTTIIHLIFSMMSVVIYVISAIFLLVGAGAFESAGMDENAARLNGNGDVYKAAGGILATVGSIFLIFALVQLYFWLCIFSFLKELKSGRLGSPA